MTTGKTIALTRWTFVGKVISLLFNMLSRLVITFLPRSKCLLISWLQPPSSVVLEPPKIKSDTVSTVSPSISHEVMGPDAMILVICIHISLPSWPPSHISCPTPLGRHRAQLSSLCYAAASHELFYTILRMVVYVCRCYSISSSRPPLSYTPPCLFYLHFYSFPANRFISTICLRFLKNLFIYNIPFKILYW